MKYLMSLIAAFLITCLIHLPASAQYNYDSIPIHISNGSGLTADLVFGYKAGATFCIDAALGEAELPPVPPMSQFDARFVGELACIGGGLMKNYHPTGTPRDTFRLRIDPGGSYPLTISWPTGLTGFSSLVLRDLNATQFNVDMLSQTQLTIPAGTVPPLYIEAGIVDGITRPEVTTLPADSITPVTARLNAGVNPHALATDAWFEWDTSGGTYGHSTVHQSAGSGSTIVSVHEGIASLPPNIPIYFRCVAQNTIGITFGSEQSFTTATSGLPPGIVTSPASAVTDSSATYSATIATNGNPAQVRFEWGISPDYNFTSDKILVTADSATVTWSASHLYPYSMYHFRVRGTSPGGTTIGAEQTFRTAGDQVNPVVPLIVADSTNRFILLFGFKAGATPCLDPALGEEELYPVPPYPTFDARFNPAHCGLLDLAKDFRAAGTPFDTFKLYVQSGANPFVVSWPSGITGFASLVLRYYDGTIHYVDMLADSSVILPAGVAPYIYIYTGLVNGGSRPVAITGAADNLLGTSARLNGIANPRARAGEAWFDWGEASATYAWATPHQDIGSDTADVTVQADLISLVPNTTYFYRMAASNSLGTSYGTEQSFVTQTVGLPASSVITSVSNITSFSANVAGTITTQGSPTKVTFEWGIPPAFDHSLPVVIIQGATAESTLTVNLPGLHQLMTYHVRIRTSNYGGYAVSEEASITVPGDPGSPVVPLQISNSSGTRLLSFGFQPGATYCIDPELGEEELPPDPPSPYLLDARFKDSRNGSLCLGNGLANNYHATAGIADTFLVRILYDAATPVVVRWPTALTGFSSMSLSAQTGGGTVTLDMLTDSSLTITGSGTSIVTIIVHPDSGYQVTQSRTIEPGWNLVSVTCYLSDLSVLGIFPGAGSKAFSYSGSRYEQQVTLANGSGYWVKFNQPAVLNIDGRILNESGIPLIKGWNLIGSISTPVPLSQISSDPPGLVISQIYGYQSGYQTVAELQPLTGYWVKSSQAGSLILSASVKVNEFTRVRIVDSRDAPPSPPEEVTSERTGKPSFCELGQNYPNPANPQTLIRYAVPASGYVKLSVYNILGQEVAVLMDGIAAAGYYERTFDGTTLASGVYVYRLSTGSDVRVKSLVLIK